MREKLVAFRVAKHRLSQEKMAKKIGYSRNHYANIESGKHDVSLKFLMGLCAAFGMSLEEAKELTECVKDKEAQNDRETR